MKKFLVFLVLAMCLVGGFSDFAQAQTTPTTITLPFSSGRFSWDAPATGSTPTTYTITCGTSVYTLSAPATEVLISLVVPGPGTYTCSIYAENQYGRSTSYGPDPVFPRFDAGNPPFAPTQLRLIVTDN